MLVFKNVLALLAVLGLVGCAATPSSSEGGEGTSGQALAARATTFDEFKKDVLREAKNYSDEKDCALEAVAEASGMTLSVSEHGKPVKLVIPSNAKIKR